MTNGQVFKHYVWIVNTLRHGGRLTLNDLNERWVNDEVADGNPLPRSSFNKYRTAIIDIVMGTGTWVRVPVFMAVFLLYS